MAKYKVLKPRFHNNMLYHPEGKRNVLIVDKPFPKTPDGLELIKESAPAAKKTVKDNKTVDRAAIKVAMLEMIKTKDNLGTDGIPNVLSLEKKLKHKVGKVLRDEIMKEIQDKIDIDSVTFVEPAGPASKVETL